MEALLVCAAPVSAGAAPLVARLAEKADLVIAVDGGAALCRSAGVQPHVVLGDMDSLAALELGALEAAGVRVVRHPAAKDLTDLELALDHAAELGADSVVVTGVSAGRIDHALAALGAMARHSSLQPRIAETDLDAWVLTPGARSHAEFRRVGTTVSVLALTGEAVVSETGFAWPLDHKRLEPLSGLGVSNVVSDPAVITVHEGVALVVAPAIP